MNKNIQNHPLTQAKPSDKTALKTASSPIDSNAPHKTTPHYRGCTIGKIRPSLVCASSYAGRPGSAVRHVDHDWRRLFCEKNPQTTTSISSYCHRHFAHNCRHYRNLSRHREELIKKEPGNGFFLISTWRKRRDSNPRDISAHTISSRAPSTTRPRFHFLFYHIYRGRQSPHIVSLFAVNLL